MKGTIKALLKLFGCVVVWALITGVCVCLPSLLVGAIIFPKVGVAEYVLLVGLCSLVLTLPFPLVWYDSPLNGHVLIYMFGGWVGGVVASIVILVGAIFGPRDVIWDVSRVILAGGLIGSITFLLGGIYEEWSITRPRKAKYIQSSA